jgi:processing peptidase subunit alpha
LKNVLGSAKSADFEPSIGNGISGRLSRNVVEANRGWVQEASAFNFGYSDSGVFGVLAVANRGNVSNLVNVVSKELKNALDVSAEEVARAKNLYKAQLLFGNESRKNLVEFLGQQVILAGKQPKLIFQKGIWWKSQSSC